MSFARDVIEQVKTVADANGIEPARLLALVEVESAGVAYWNVYGLKRPAIRFEGHYFYRLLRGARRRRAVEAGLASPRAGAVRNPRSYKGRYDLLYRAARISQPEAYMSTSWGVGQVMGAHYEKLGFETIHDMVERCRTVGGQVEVMVRYLKRFGLMEAFRRGDMHAVFRGYNGPAYRRLGYHTKWEAAYQRWLRRLRDKPVPGARPAEPLLRRLGYKGDYYREVRAFQRDEGLVVDGIPGPMTMEALHERVAALDEKRGEDSVGVGVGVGVAGEIGRQVVDGARELGRDVAGGAPWLEYVLLAVTVAGAALVVYGIYSKWRRRRDSRDDEKWASSRASWRRSRDGW